MNLDKVNLRPPLESIPEDYIKPSSKYMDGMTKRTIEKHRDTWLKNLKENIKNYDFFKRDAGLLKKLEYPGPAYLVGASPSLGLNINELKKKKGTIFACSHSLKLLLENDIKPDFVVLVDAQERSKCYIDNINSEGLNLLVDICVSPEILEIWKGGVWFFKGTHGDDIDEHVSKLTDFDNKITTGGSVISTAMILALSLGFKKLVFVGNDFSFPLKDYYAAGIPDKDEYDKSLINSVDACYTYDIEGEKVNTVGRLFLTKLFLDFMSISMQDIIFINATEGGILGAYKEGNLRTIEQMSLKEV